MNDFFNARDVLKVGDKEYAMYRLDALEKAGCGRIAPTVDQLCRADLKHFRAALASGLQVSVACTQEQALFEEVAGEAGDTGLVFANIRETGGWSEQATASGPKAAAILAAAAETAARQLRAVKPSWWVEATTLGDPKG